MSTAVRHVHHVPHRYHVLLRHEPRQAILRTGFLAQAGTDQQDPVREGRDPLGAGETETEEAVFEGEEAGEGGEVGAEQEWGQRSLREVIGDGVLDVLVEGGAVYLWSGVAQERVVVWSSALGAFVHSATGCWPYRLGFLLRYTQLGGVPLLYHYSNPST
jgi:hypothetical protein